MEPLSVAVHACQRAGVSIGSKVLICGAGIKHVVVKAHALRFIFKILKFLCLEMGPQFSLNTMDILNMIISLHQYSYSPSFCLQYIRK